jgi:hypothetical protein
MYFTYNASSAPMAVSLNGTKYFYATNLQNDIIVVLDHNVNSIVEYTYDAWVIICPSAAQWRIPSVKSPPALPPLCIRH